MRSALLSVLLISCSLGPPPGITPPAAQGCDPIARAILGTWTNRNSAMEVRPDGSVLREGLEGSWRWARPGQAMLDFAGAHELHTFALATGAELLDVDDRGRARIWSRVSIMPSYPAACFDIRGSVVGDWSDGVESESFERDGTFVRGDYRGNWTVSDQGVLEVGIGARGHRYRIAFAAPDRLVTMLDGEPGPDEPRPAAVVEARLE